MHRYEHERDRRLATIVAADIVGYSRLMDTDEEGTYSALHATRCELIEPGIDSHNGRIVKHTGDGFLAEFSHIMSAVHFAMELQEQMGRRMADVPDDLKIKFRIGINLGDIIIDESGDIFGDGVNVAARLEPIAIPGGICISGTVYDVIHKKLDVEFNELGPQKVKNISTPVRAYDIRWDGEAGKADERAVAPQKQKPAGLLLAAAAMMVVVAGLIFWFTSPMGGGETETTIARDIYPGSIAVLPLENLSPDEEQEYFASGMYDTLINSLCKVSALRVTSRTSASRVDTDLTVPMIGRALGVANVIEGSVYREGNRVRVVVQLIDAATDQHRWAETYERDFTDVISLQADVARAVANAIQVQLTTQDEGQLEQVLSIKPETFEAYLRAMFQFRKENRSAYRRGIEILEEALENDPTSALAYAGLAQGYSELGHSPFPVRGAYERAKAAADKAIELDDSLAEAHLSVAMYKLYYEYDWNGAEVAFKRALELNPSLTDAWYHWAWQLELFNRNEEAIAAGAKTVELSPLSPFYISWLAEQYRNVGDYERALDLAESVLELYPEYPVAWMALGNAYGEQGRFDEAIEAHTRLGDSAFWSWARGYTYALAGDMESVREILAEIEHKADNGLPLTLLYASLGDAEQAIHWMEQVGEVRMPWYPWLLGWFPQFRALNDHPLVIEKAKALGVPLRGS
jgi:adenylate cyclase